MANMNVSIRGDEQTGRMNVDILEGDKPSTNGPVEITNTIWGFVVATLRSKGSVSVIEELPVSSERTLNILGKGGESEAARVQMKGIVERRITIQIVSQELIPTQPSKFVPSHE